MHEPGPLPEPLSLLRLRIYLRMPGDAGIEHNYTPHSTVDIWLKDLGIVLDIAKSAKFSAPVTASALRQFVAASWSGLGKQDDAAVAKVYARNAELALPNQ